ncbi:MAG: RagB/SusD family nutrient uptake outer membrane protein [Prolixibacteraceae bacterium]
MKIIKLLPILFAIFVLSGCEDFIVEEPESVLTQVDFYVTPTRINQGVLGCYAGMTKIMNDEWMYTELRSDNTCISSTGSSSSTRQYLTSFAHFSLISSEPKLQDYWYNTFQNISNINAVLPSVLDNSYIAQEELRAQYEAELRFIRGYHYLNLVNLFGDMFKVTSLIGPNEAKKLERSPVAEIYDEIIIPDLKIAANNAPSKYDQSDLGRVNKWAAKSMLAKAYMMRGGAENLALAKPLLVDVIQNSGASLEANFAAIFDPTNEMNNEILFAIRYLGGSAGIGSPFWEYFAPEGSANTFLKVGTPDGDNNPTLEIMNLFNQHPEDKRIEASFKVFARSPTRTYPYITKYIDENISQALNAENDWIVLRLADVYLLYAEILAQDGNHMIANNQVNIIRNRAGLANMAPFASKEMALDSIYQERRLELAFENHRWFDLLRMSDSYNDVNKMMEIIKTHTFVTDAILYSSFNPLPVPDMSNYKNEHILLPIPQTEIDTNNEMDVPQNPGY